MSELRGHPELHLEQNKGSDRGWCFVRRKKTLEGRTGISLEVLIWLLMGPGWTLQYSSSYNAGGLVLQTLSNCFIPTTTAVTSTAHSLWTYSLEEAAKSSTDIFIFFICVCHVWKKKKRKKGRGDSPSQFVSAGIKSDGGVKAALAVVSKLVTPEPKPCQKCTLCMASLHQGLHTCNNQALLHIC